MSNGQLPLSRSDRMLSNIEGFSSEFTAKASVLDRMLRKAEDRMRKKVRKIESRIARKAGAANLPANIPAFFDPSVTAASEAGAAAYIPRLDSIEVLLRMVGGNSFLTNGQPQIRKLAASMHFLQHKANSASALRRHLVDRIKGYTHQFDHLDCMKEFKALNSAIAEYSAQVRQFKQLLNDPSRLQQRLLSVARQLPAFKRLFAKYSALSALFQLPGTEIDQAQIGLLQTRSNVQTMLTSRVAMGGPNAYQMLEQSVTSAKDQLKLLQEKLNKAGGFSDNDEESLSEFKPRMSHSRNLFSRLEFGTNIQSQRSNQYFPTTTDLGLSVGYRINEQSLVGIGCSYKIGWGSDIRNIQVRGEGIGLRSFLDYKIKGSFFASGGFELNYQQSFNALTIPKDFTGWTQSGLLGISKVVSLKTKLLKKTKLQLLYDLLSRHQTVPTQPLRFRVGYNF